MEIFRQLLEGVRYIHSEDVLHRDLKVRFAFAVTGLQFKGLLLLFFFCGFASTRIEVTMLSKFLSKMSVRKTRAQTSSYFRM